MSLISELFVVALLIWSVLVILAELLAARRHAEPCLGVRVRVLTTDSAGRVRVTDANEALAKLTGGSGDG